MRSGGKLRMKLSKYQDVKWALEFLVWLGELQQTPIFETDKKSLCEFTKSVYMFLQIKYQPNITNGGGMIWGVRIAIFTEIRHLV